MVAAQELYSRDLVYHKVKKTWYKREKGITNYAYISVKEEFSTVSWSFVQCNETIKSSDLLSAAELNEYVKMLNQCIVCLQTYFYDCSKESIYSYSSFVKHPLWEQ